MKLFPPGETIEVYEMGFGPQDPLGRVETGRQLTALVDRVEDPIVLALDGPWGSGKSYFLQRWVGAHKDLGGEAITVYLDAFKHDYIDDPLIALTSAITERFDREDEQRVKTVWERARRAAAFLSRPLFRIGMAAASAGVSELTGPVLDEIFSSGKDEIEAGAIKKFWAMDEGRKVAMAQFRSALEELTSDDPDTGTKGRSMVLVVDELDRCRPDYALAMLEVAKHFFAMPRVHFVLGVNMAGLEHMVQARYGSGIDAAEYLKRFVNVTMRLPDHVDVYRRQSAARTYFRTCANEMGISERVTNQLGQQIELVQKGKGISLRDVERVLARIVLMPHQGFLSGDTLPGRRDIILSLVLFQVLRPDLFRATFDRTLELPKVRAFFGMTDVVIGHDRGERRDPRYSFYAGSLYSLWSFVISSGAEPADNLQGVRSAFDSWGDFSVQDFLDETEREYFSTFNILD